MKEWLRTGRSTVLVVAAWNGQSAERQLQNAELVAADYWSDELVILSAGLGFHGIVGVPGDDPESVRDAGGTYNPGGPSPTPFPGVRYTTPGPPDLEPVTTALDNPMRVSTP